MLVALRDQRKISFVELSGREKEGLKLVAQGCSSKTIAKMLELSLGTVDHHRAHRIKKFKMKSTANLVNYVVRNAVIVADHSLVYLFSVLRPHLLRCATCSISMKNLHSLVKSPRRHQVFPTIVFFVFLRFILLSVTVRQLAR